MSTRRFLIFLLFVSPIVLLAEKPKFDEMTVTGMKELSNREVTAHARTTFSGSITQADWQACVPQDSIEFPDDDWPADYKKRMFPSDELADLMKCDTEKCAFNFLPHEIKKLMNKNTEEERMRAHHQFFKDRKDGKTGMTQKNLHHLIRSRDKAFDICKNDAFDRLLDERPFKDADYRFELNDFDRRARPTSRLLQSARFINRNLDELCYVEALIFTDHYSLDRIEVWSLSPGVIRLQVRDRLDFLHSWVRRLRKPEIRSVLQEWAEQELQSVIQCISERHSEKKPQKPKKAPSEASE